MPTTKRIVLVSAALTATTALVSACGDEPEGRPPFEVLDATDGPASLPEAGPPADAGSPPDAKEPYVFADEEVVCAGESAKCAKELVAGQAHYCARMADGTVRCWGRDDYGSIGHAPATGGEDGGIIALPVDGLSGVTQLSGGGNTNCARLEDGTIRCWGSNRSGELGLTVDPPTADWDWHATPVTPAGVEDAVRVDVGQGAVCARRESGKLTCWGTNAHGQLARALPDNPYAPAGGPAEAKIGALAVRSVAIGSYTTVAQSNTGELWVWGAVAGEEGFNAGVSATLSPTLTPRRIERLEKVTNFGVSMHVKLVPPRPTPGSPQRPPLPPQAHACAIMDGEVYCWGRSDKTALCTGLPDAELLPRRAPLSSKAWPQRLAVGHEITCVRLSDGTAQCCGSNEKGRLGAPPSTTHSPLFTSLPLLEGRVIQIVAANTSTCALLQGGTVSCWGSNYDRELGTPEPDEGDHPEPHPIAF